MKEEALQKGVIIAKKIASVNEIIKTCVSLLAKGELDNEVILSVWGNTISIPASISKKIIPMLESYKEQLEKEFEEL